MSDTLKKATKAGTDCLKMPVFAGKEAVYVVDGVCYWRASDAKFAQKRGGNPQPKAFLVTRLDGGKFDTKEV